MESLNRPPLKLVFGTPEFLPEGVVQSTVRVGQKWRDDLKGKVAPRIPCVDLEGTVLGTATVVGSLFGLFKDFGYIGSVVNNRESNRDFDGLIDSLSEYYPGFNPETDQVAVIFFKFVSCIPDAAEDEDIEDTSADEKAEADRVAAEEAEAKEAAEAEAQAKADAEADAEGADNIEYKNADGETIGSGDEVTTESTESKDDSSDETDEETKVES